MGLGANPSVLIIGCVTWGKVLNLSVSISLRVEWDQKYCPYGVVMRFTLT